MAMPDILHRDAAREIDITAALNIPHLGVLRARGEKWRRDGNSTRHRGGQSALELFVGSHLVLNAKSPIVSRKSTALPRSRV
jgi:hypothetical protein